MMVGENIKRLRTLKGITQKELGRLSGINEVQIRKYELGKQNPKYEKLEKIANGLNCNVANLLSCSNVFKKATTSNTKEKYLLDKFNTLTPMGQEKLFDLLNLLTKVPEYQKTPTEEDK